MAMNDAEQPGKSPNPLDDPDARAFARVLLSGLAMVGILARRHTGNDGFYLSQAKPIAARAVAMADALMEELAKA